MRIGIVTSSFPRFEGDPAGPFVAEHAAWLRSQGHRVEVIAAGQPGHELKEGPSITRIPAGGELFYRGGAPEALARKRRTWRHAVRFSAAMTREVVRRSRNWDVVIAHWLVPSALAACAIRRPILAIAHSGDVHLLARTRLAKPMAALLAARRARVVFVSNFVRRRFYDSISPRLMRRIDTRATVCAMGVDVGRFRRAAETPAPARKKPVVVFLGRLVPVKGVDIFIAAAHLVSSDVQFVVAGDGPHALTLARRARGAANVRMVGEVRGAERDALLAHADLVVLPSVEVEGGRTEGMPVVALEAMAARTPLVVSTVGGLGELPASTVRRVPPCDPLALATAIDELASNSALSESQIDAGSRFVDGYDWSVVGPKLLP